MLRYCTFTALYVAQGMPAGLMVVALPAWLVKHGLGAGAIASYLFIAFLPWSFKLVAGPLMDRFSFLPMGRRRPWALAAQLGLLVSFMLMAAVPDPVNHIYGLAAIGFMVNLFASFQDVAVDGLAIDLLPEDQQARANGFMWGGKTVGRAVAAAGGSSILNWLGYPLAILSIASFLAVIFLFPLLLRERPGERLLPWSPGKASQLALRLQLKDWRSIVGKLVRAVWLPMSRIVTLGFFFFYVGDGVLEVLLPVLTVGELGWTDVDYSHLSAMSRLIAGLLGMLIGATVVDRLGHIRSVVIAIIPLVLANIVMGLFPGLWHFPGTIIAYVVCRDLFVVTITITFLAISMGLSWQRVAATQFALYMALSNLSDTVGTAVAGLLDPILEHHQFFFVVAVGYGTLLVFLALTDMKVHREHLNALEANSLKAELSGNPE